MLGLAAPASAHLAAPVHSTALAPRVSLEMAAPPVLAHPLGDRIARQLLKPRTLVAHDLAARPAVMLSQEKGEGGVASVAFGSGRIPLPRPTMDLGVGSLGGRVPHRAKCREGEEGGRVPYFDLTERIFWKREPFHAVSK